jgi:hypothetical protein
VLAVYCCRSDGLICTSVRGKETLIIKKTCKHVIPIFAIIRVVCTHFNFN